MLGGDLDIHRLADPQPPQSILPAPGTVADATVPRPLPNDVEDERNLEPEVVRRRDALELRADLGPSPRGVARAAGARARCRLPGWGRKVEERLQRIRKYRPAIKRRLGQRPGLLQKLGSVQRQMPKVAPRARRVNDNLGMVGEVELNGTSVTVICGHS